jgi:hypothetical protein
MSSSGKLSTLKRYLASVSVGHTLKDRKFDRSAPAIKTILKGLSRVKSGDRRRVRFLMGRQVRAILHEVGGPSLVACFEWHQRPENVLAGHLTWGRLSAE